MFRRAFWFTTGAAAGVWATTKVNRKLRSLTPESLAGRAADKAVETGHRLRDFALDVRDNMAQREDELHDALGLDAPVDADHPALPAQPAARAPLTSTGTAKPRRAPQIKNTHTTHPYDRKEDH
ncbi:hypothetical protein DVA86_06705 [Streptomyces armeniacus]|uniref:Uncharacterized protein n=1 Tax=Streptomyces armeniacus TaxID=83291 RepID=A0A345XL69_9ACTN|nr:DUF6167 family protein [Streptomyces armeniacus]AXK32385.1 hypothetical protein DVA86_06705 [Streptomyces armeniacus]